MLGEILKLCFRCVNELIKELISSLKHDVHFIDAKFQEINGGVKLPNPPLLV